MLLFVKRTWVNIKKYWHVATIGTLIVLVYIISRKKPDGLLKILSIRTEQHKKEIEALGKARTDEVQARDKAQKEYLEKTEVIKNEHEQKIVSLAKEREKRVRELLEKGKNDPDNAAKVVSELYGIKHVKIEDFDNNSDN